MDIALTPSGSFWPIARLDLWVEDQLTGAALLYGIAMVTLVENMTVFRVSNEC